MSAKIPTVKELFKAGAHVGHLRSKTDARSRDFIYVFKNKIAVIDLDQTVEQIKKATDFLNSKAEEGGLVLFSGTKLQAKGKVKEVAEKLKMPYVNERWPGGLITNFPVVSKSIKKMIKTEKDIEENKYEDLKKKERLIIQRGLDKSRLIFDGLRGLERLPDVVFLVDAKEEDIAVLEAKAKGIPVVALCDTNTNPNNIDYPIVINDDSMKSIAMVLDVIVSEFEKNYKPKVVDTGVEKRVDKAMSKAKELKPVVKKEVKKNDKKTKKS